MRVVVDIECNSINNPTQIWCIVLKDIDTNDYIFFRNVTTDEIHKNWFLSYAKSVDTWIGHNFLGYDYPVLNKLLGLVVPDVADKCIDTFIISKLVDYSRKQGHSIEAYGEEFGLPKGKNHYLDFFKKWSQELEDYCVRDVDICHRIYLLLQPILTQPSWQPAISLEQSFQLVCNNLQRNGFCFDGPGATRLLSDITTELIKLDEKILKAFPPKEVLIREFTPKLTKFGTISRTSVPRSLHPNIHMYESGRTYRHTRLEDFNPNSHKQLIAILNEAKWRPIDKTQAHIEAERNRLTDKIKQFKVSGWKINENNLSTLPKDAPAPARLLAKRILLESRRRTLTEWISLASEDGRIHGKFYGIGAWTHRMAHQQPNTANIPNEYDTNGTKKLLGKEMRSLWCAPKDRLLVGVDAEGIQLRIFAHYIDDKEFTNALVRGKKSDKTDPHSLNQRILGPACKSRQAAKRFIYALLLGAGIGKLVQILEASKSETESALERLLQRYQGFAYLKKHVIPADAKKGWFVGLDGRHVALPGNTIGERRHLCMSGYLQNGEAIIMKKATLRWHDELVKEGGSLLVNFVHDEWQTETPDRMEVALRVAARQAESLRLVGEELGLKCPLAGSYWNDDHKTYTIGTNWSVTH